MWGLQRPHPSLGQQACHPVGLAPGGWPGLSGPPGTCFPCLLPLPGPAAHSNALQPLWPQDGSWTPRLPQTPRVQQPQSCLPCPPCPSWAPPHPVPWLRWATHSDLCPWTWARALLRCPWAHGLLARHTSAHLREHGLCLGAPAGSGSSQSSSASHKTSLRLSRQPQPVLPTGCRGAGLCSAVSAGLAPGGTGSLLSTTYK